MVKDKVEVKACRRCKGLFETTSDVDVCPVCKEALNKVFREVKQFIRKNAKSGIAEVSEACHVSPKQIIQWIREERLYFTEESQVAIPCLQCGEKIHIGKYCDTCRSKMHRNFSSISRKPQEIEEDSLVKVKTNERLRFQSYK